LLSLLLFFDLSLLLLLLFIPNEYGISGASVTLDIVRRKFESRYSDDKKVKIAVLGRTADDVVKISIIISVFLGILGILFTLRRWHWLALVAGAACFMTGFLLSQAVVENEFKRWQSMVFNEVPVLINFAPAFLKVGGITLRDAISMTIPFLSSPLREEIWTMLDRIRRTGNVKNALELLADRVKHPAMDAICTRLSAAWDASPSPDLFADLSDQMQDMEEIAAAGGTAARAGVFALICVLGLAGSVLVFGYPAWIYEMSKMTMGLF
jgi:hypothetical protein